MPVRTKRGETTVPPIPAKPAKRVTVLGTAPLGGTRETQATATKQTSTQFLRAEWYRKNQARLASQAKALTGQGATKGDPAPTLAAKPKTAPKAAVRTGPTEILKMLTAPGSKTSAPVALQPPKSLAPVKSKRSPAPQGGPWMVLQMKQALQKYEALTTARSPSAPSVDRRK